MPNFDEAGRCKTCHPDYAYKGKLIATNQDFCCMDCGQKVTKASEFGQAYASRSRLDAKMYAMCAVVASFSSCLSRHIGAVIARDDTVIATGYNGPPRGVRHCNDRHKYDPFLFHALQSINKLQPSDQCPRTRLGYKSGEGLEFCIAAHAEENAIVNAAMIGVATVGCTMYMTCGIPCKNCLIKVINAGIKEIVVTGMSLYDEESRFLLQESKLTVREFYKED